jgi:cytochrome c556
MMKSVEQRSAAVAVAILIVGAAWIPNGSTGAPISAADAKFQDEIILARQGLMEAISDLMNEGEVPENDAQAATMQANAQTVALTLPPLKFLFPVETRPRNSKFKASYRSYALPAVWENPEKFSQYLDASIGAARALEQASDARQLPALARRLLATCDACHTEFRAPFDSPFDAPQFQEGTQR